MFNTPILFLIFNRPDLTEKVFDKIKTAKPKKLFIAADGPRENTEGELELCTKTRKITEKIDWDCHLQTLFREKNLGCKIALSSAIDWFFNNVEEGIILEDDCLPDLSFFRFCEEMLRKFRTDKRVMMITGTNTQDKWKNRSQSYHFSYFFGMWGWASWKRAWDYYDIEVKLWESDEVKERIKDVISNRWQYAQRKIRFEKTFMQIATAWDYQWHFAMLINSGLTVVPSVNLVVNIGLNETSRPIKSLGSNNRWAKLTLQPIKFPLKNNDFVAVDREYDKFSDPLNVEMLKYIYKYKVRRFLKKDKFFSKIIYILKKILY
ncbi:MAG: glycosyltransferase family 2 protein [Solirubrobacterales bacterium]|nr:glycosyltransferase family 2 protein [Solirubrobacterales bacterium]